ncbi:MAG: hypothetical protein ACJAXH_001767 [Colwellia sp.]|jgi:hypothetical protein
MNNLVKLIAGSFLMISGAVSATLITDVQDYSNNTATEFFVLDDASKYDSPYYRGQNEDWSWIHEAIAGTFTSIALDVSAYDVDSPNEQDAIYVFDGASWLNLGDLVGMNNIWTFTTFDLSGYSWANTQVNAGLQVKLDIDTSGEGWIVTLEESILSVDGGAATAVPEPSTLAIFALGIMGLASRRFKKQS